MSTYHDATAAWNSAMYSALAVCSPTVVDLVFDLDREVDRLFEAAKAQRWSITDFRHERAKIGQLAAQYLDRTRKAAGLPALSLRSAWSWEAPSVSEPAER